MLIQDQVAVFQWSGFLVYIKYGGPILARWVTLQNYFGTTLLKGCRPLIKQNGQIKIVLCVNSAVDGVCNSRLSKRDDVCPVQGHFQHVLCERSFVSFMFSKIKKIQYFVFWSDLKCITLCNAEFKGARPLPYITTVITANMHGRRLLRYEEDNVNCVRNFCQTMHHIAKKYEYMNLTKLAQDADQWWNQWCTNTGSSLTDWETIKLSWPCLWRLLPSGMWHPISLAYR
jgi:hypothetical protein